MLPHPVAVRTFDTRCACALGGPVRLSRFLLRPLGVGVRVVTIFSEHKVCAGYISGTGGTVCSHTLSLLPIAVMISTGVGCRLQICRRGDPQRFDSAFAVLFVCLNSGAFLCQDPTPLHPCGSDLSKEG